MLSDFYGWKSLASLDLHGPHLSGGDVVFRAVIGPVPAGGPDEHPPVQRHPHRQHLAPSRPHTSGQAAQAPPHQKGKRRIQDRLSRADLQRHPPGKSISFAEKAHHFYRRPGLLRLQKAAVHQYVDPGAGRSPPYCEFLQGPHQHRRYAVCVQGEHQQQIRTLLWGERSTPQRGILVRRLSPTRKKLFDIPPGVGTGRPGTPIDDQELSHARTSSLMAPASSSSRRKRTLQLRNSILWALRAASRRKSACSSSPVSP